MIEPMCYKNLIGVFGTSQCNGHCLIDINFIRMPFLTAILDINIIYDTIMKIIVLGRYN